MNLIDYESLSQKWRLYFALLDGEAHTVPDLLTTVYGNRGPSSSRLGARIWDLRNDGYSIESNPTHSGSKIWWYKMKRPTLKLKKLCESSCQRKAK